MMITFNHDSNVRWITNIKAKNQKITLMVQAVPYSALTGLVQMNRRQGSILKNISMLVLDYGDTIDDENPFFQALQIAC